MFCSAVCKIFEKVGGFLRDDVFVHLLRLGLCGCAATALAQTPGTFAPTGNMTAARSSHTATLLPNGKVLIAGGGSATIELYDPSTGTFTATGGATASKNVGSATLLPDGSVLLIEAQSVGGYYPSGWISSVGTQGAEIYDPSTGVVTATGSMIEAQTGYTAPLLANGKVLITGGTNRDSDCCSQAASPELYDPSTQTFSVAGSYADTGASAYVGTEGLTYTTATPLTDGTVLISSESAAELYDPVANAFKLTGSMTAPYFFYGGTPSAISGRAAALLLDGKVLLTGGAGAGGDTGDVHPLSNSETYDPSAGTFRAAQNMATFRCFHTATTLPDGTVLVTGGLEDFFYTTTAIAELYSPTAKAFLVAGNMQSGRFSHRSTLLADGRVLITGGSFSNGYTTGTYALSSAEVYTPMVLVPAPVLFSLSGDGKGQGAIWHAATGQVVSPDDPAAAGEYLSMYTTSLGDGSVIPPQVAIGGQLAEVLYFGDAPGSPGYNQVNFRMPSGVAPGPAVPVRLMYLGRPSNQVTIGVQ